MTTVLVSLPLCPVATRKRRDLQSSEESASGGSEESASGGKLLQCNNLSSNIVEYGWGSNVAFFNASNIQMYGSLGFKVLKIQVLQ